ncbi:MAG TPA: NUDIX domain-containing protein [Thermoplasmata archaeon]|nr:NUDIX domain-containing protein [Thermoplasmata archaeon]
MVLQGVGLVPGRASGRIHLVAAPLDWAGARPGADQVLALPALWWPPPDGVPDAPRAFLLQGLPATRTPAVTLAPVVADIDMDVLREGESADVDGSEGTVLLPGVTETEVVTTFLEREDGRILLLQRSEQVGSFQGRWAGVSGFLEDPTPLGQALREVREETGLERAELTVVAEGRPVYARDKAQVFVVHPYRIRTRRTDVRLDWEHTAFEWVDPGEIRHRPIVPKLDRAWESVRPTPPPKE